MLHNVLLGNAVCLCAVDYVLAAAALTCLVVWQSVVFVCVCVCACHVVQWSSVVHHPLICALNALKVCKMLRGVGRWAHHPRGSRWTGVRGLGEPKQRVSNHDNHLLTRNLWSVC